MICYLLPDLRSLIRSRSSKWQRLLNNIPLNVLIFLHIFFRAIGSRCQHMCAFFSCCLQSSCETNHTDFYKKRFLHTSIALRGLTTTGNGQEPCILISKVTQLHFHIRILSLSQENVIFFESFFLERNVSNHSDLLICGLF